MTKGVSQRKGVPFLTDTIDGETLVRLFPSEGSTIPERSFAMPSGMQVKLTTIPATPAKIMEHPFAESELKGVIKLQFYKTDVSDAQIAALVTRFPNIEKVVFNIAPNITDRAIGEIGKLRNLTTFEIIYCPQVTSLAALPLERMEELRISLDRSQGRQISERIAKSPRLRTVKYGYLYKPAKEEILPFGYAHNHHDIFIEIENSSELEPGTFAALNLGRRRFIHVKTTVSEKSSGPMKQPPPFPDTADHFCPPPDMPEEDMIAAIARRKEAIKITSVYGSNHISYTGTIALRQLEKTEELYYGNNSGASRRAIEILLTKHPKPEKKTWQNLKKAHFFYTPLSDEGLKLLSSSAPQLDSLALYGIDSITFQGLQYLWVQGDALRFFSMGGCPSIDPFAVSVFRKRRPEITFKIECVPDPTVAPLARAEASYVMGLPGKHYLFLAEYLGKSRPISETDQIECVTGRVNEFYADKLIEIGIDPAVNLTSQWMLCDQILQAYVNIFRVAWAVRKELCRSGLFDNPDLPRPRTVKEILDFLCQGKTEAKTDDFPGKPKKETLEIVARLSSITRDVRKLDLCGLAISRIPQCFLNIFWPNLSEVDLRETYITEDPRLTSLLRIHFIKDCL